MTDRAILHVDMDAFFAAVEVLDDPRLKGKPVMVGGTPEQRGVVAAASYEARAFGVHSAMSSARAHKLCPQGVFLPGRHGRYQEISRQIFAIFRQYTPLVEPLSVDEAFLDVTGCQRLFGPAEKIGRQIKERIRRQIGLTASVGVAPNKFLAKLASDLEKPDGFVVIAREDAAARLARLPIGRLWGVGPASEKILRGLGVHLVADLLKAPRSQLMAALGEHAEHLLELAVGHDERPVVPEHTAQSIGKEVTFARDIAAADILQDILDSLAAQVARNLRREGLLARTVHLKARYPDFTTVTRAVTLAQPTESTVLIRDAARELLAQRLQRRGRPLRLIGVSVSNLGPPEQQQGDLFGALAASRQKKIDSVLDSLHDKFGDMTRRGLRRRTTGD